MKTYSYMVSYTKNRFHKPKRYRITNTYDLAEYEIKYTTNPQKYRIIPITNIRKHNKIWKKCPF